MIENARATYGVELSEQNAELLDLLGIMAPAQAGRLVAGLNADRISTT